MRKTKIICTLGPSSNTPERIEALIQAGMDCARLNFSHGTHDDHAEVFRRVRQASERLGRPVAILQDLCGPKIRVGKMKGGKVTLEEGAEVTITTKKVIGTASRIPTEYEALPQDVRRGEPILLDDGLIKLEVLKVKKDEVKCRVVNGGVLKDRKGMNLPGSAVSQPALTEKDIADAEFGKQLGVDYVALSFVQGPEDVRALREILGDPMSGGTPIIAKIERPNAVERLDAIIAAADGIMVARGDLGVELPPEKVPVIQKIAIERGNAFGKLVITATQMLESMTKNPRPTRAEVSDVANAVFDGSDAVMLSGETAAGDHPVESVEMMSSIVMEVEASPRYRAQANRAFLKDLPDLPERHGAGRGERRLGPGDRHHRGLHRDRAERRAHLRVPARGPDRRLHPGAGDPPADGPDLGRDAPAHQALRVHRRDVRRGAAVPGGAADLRQGRGDRAGGRGASEPAAVDQSAQAAPDRVGGPGARDG